MFFQNSPIFSALEYAAMILSVFIFILVWFRLILKFSVNVWRAFLFGLFGWYDRCRMSRLWSISFDLVDFDKDGFSIFDLETFNPAKWLYPLSRRWLFISLVKKLKSS